MKGAKKVSGVLQVTRSGRGFLLQEEKDIPVPKEYLNGALNGDVVEVDVVKGRFEPIGKVANIIERKTTHFVGVVKKAKSGLVVEPDDSRVYFNIEIMDSAGAPVGNKVIIEICEWKSEPPRGRVREVIGKAGEHETEIRAIVASKGFSSTFSEAVLNEADDLYKSGVSNSDVDREDFRDTLTFTIDPDDAKDFDDAISYKEVASGNIEVGVHIADVSYFVRPKSLIDKEAFNRATSVYLVDRTIPMLPPQLSEDLCSLRPNEDKFTFSAIFTINSNSEVIGKRFTRGIINSKKRFTYDDADKALKEGEYHDVFSRLWEIASKFRKERKKDGSIMFEGVELKPILNNKKEVVEFRKIEYTESHQLIEEFMLLANREVATFVSEKLGKKSRLFVYRIHDVPNQEKIDALSTFLRAIGYSISIGKNVTGSDLNNIFKQVEGKPEEKLIKTATVRTMAKAIYTTKNIGHFGLAFANYANFTSPIRRYPDIMVHRSLAKILAGEKITEDPQIIEQRAIHASEKEAAASQAERESIKMKQVEYFAKLIGQTREGVVSGVTEWGVYVQDKDTGAEGMVRLMSMTDDSYVHDPKKFAVVGEKTKNVIQLGDPVTVVVEKVDVDERTIDLKFS